MRINNINSDILNDFSAAPQGYIVGKFYLIVSLITFFHVIQSANAHNFVDDDTLTALAKSIQNLIHLVESECCVVIKLFKDNKMIVNPGNFQAIILNKKKNNHTQEILKIDKNAVKIKSSVRLVGVQTDAKLNFNLYITRVSLSAVGEFNAPFRLRKFLGFEEKNVLKNSYFYSNFTYCSVVWMISHAKSINILRVLQKRELRFLYDDYHSLSEKILKKSRKVCVEVKRLRYFYI